MSAAVGNENARTVATKQKLFTSALRLVGERGVAAVTVDEIAAAAGVAKGTLYYNFGSKDKLIEELLGYGVQEFAARLREAPDFEAMVDAAMLFLGEHASLAQLLVSELWRQAGQWQRTLTPLRDEVVSILRGHLEVAAERGALPPEVDVRTAAAALFGTLLVVALDWRVFHPERERAEITASLLVLLRGVADGERAG